MQLPLTLLSSRLFHFQLIPIIPLAFYLKKVYILPTKELTCVDVH